MRGGCVDDEKCRVCWMYMCGVFVVGGDKKEGKKMNI
jgi:hypothetical protein